MTTNLTTNAVQEWEKVADFDLGQTEPEKRNMETNPEKNKEKATRKPETGTFLVAFWLVLQRGLEPRTPCLKGRKKSRIFRASRVFDNRADNKRV